MIIPSNTQAKCRKYSKTTQNSRFSIVHRIFVFSAVCCIFAVFRCYINGFESPKFSSMENAAAFHPKLIIRVINYVYLYILNAWLLVFPNQLCVDYSMGCIPLIISLNDYRLFITVACCLAILLLLLFTMHSYCRENEGLIVFSLSVVVVAFLPASNLLVTVGFVIAERVLYLPSLGVCILCAVLYEKLYCFGCIQKRNLLRTILVIVVFVCIQKSSKRSAEWRNEIDLYRSALNVCPLNAKMHYNIGKILADKGDAKTAEVFYRKALILHPSYNQAMNNLANLFLRRRNYDEAERLLNRTVHLRPDFAAAWMNLGLTQMAKQNFEESEKSLMTALALRPVYPDCFFNLGALYLQQNRTEMAEMMWKKAVRQQPTHLQSWVNLLILLDSQGRYNDAVRLGRTALRYLSTNAAIHFQTGTSYAKIGQFEDAEHHILLAVNKEKANAIYWTNLGILYQRWRRNSSAIKAYENALNISPSSEIIWRALKSLKETK